jgi:peptide/nickel transport system permease protein
MILFIVRRVLSAALLIVAVSLLAYVLLSPAAGNIARNVLGEDATAEQVALLNQQLGLDRPLIVQYLDWAVSALTGDLGTSYFSRQPVAASLAARLPVTVTLVALVTVFSGMLGFAIGIWAAVKRGIVDRVLLVVVTIADALPAFILAIFFVTIFAIGLGWFPATGFTPFFKSPADWARGLVLPVTAMTLLGLAGIAQQVRSSAIGVLRMDYVRTLRSRGLPARRIILTSVLRNASVNGLTALAVQTVGMLGASVVIEQIFALQGLGSFAVEATTRTDIPVIVGVLLAYVLIVVVVNLLVDLAVAWINPKVRLS